ncbi:uncharacterized protein LOC121386392 [Gigantopelta aegis]|uniref:uncharacterized protein LOC121386392 n=1 Tax=Gigantopelta aegis TaxID=1735272 RepID=UPI001B88B5AA|nr:uncharacterized protein LOC121386392 [Gigantopelta aegis]
MPGKLCFLALLLTIDVCLGFASTTINCAADASSGERTSLTCDIAGTIASGIVWVRPNGQSPQLVVSCNRDNTICMAPGSISGYSVVVEPPTQGHTLTIDSFNLTTDVGEWSCLDGIGSGELTCIQSQTFPDPNPESQVSESTIIIIVVVAVLLVVAIAVSWFCYKRMKQQPKSKEEQTENKTQEAEDEKGQHDK